MRFEIPTGSTVTTIHSVFIEPVQSATQATTAPIRFDTYFLLPGVVNDQDGAEVLSAKANSDGWSNEVTREVYHQNKRLYRAAILVELEDGDTAVVLFDLRNVIEHPLKVNA
jgi:hypothetical protein